MEGKTAQPKIWAQRELRSVCGRTPEPILMITVVAGQDESQSWKADSEQ
jgi:hypothetical protein